MLLIQYLPRRGRSWVPPMKSPPPSLTTLEVGGTVELSERDCSDGQHVPGLAVTVEKGEQNQSIYLCEDDQFKDSQEGGDDQQRYSGDEEMNVKKGPDECVMKNMSENDDNGTRVPETGTPSVSTSMQHEKARMNEGCVVNKDGWCFTHNCKTTTISVKSKIWQKNAHTGMFGWKSVKKRIIIWRPGSVGRVAPDIPVPDDNLGGVLGCQTRGGVGDRHKRKVKVQNSDVKIGPINQMGMYNDKT